jgi:hypothetical protein
VEIIHSAQKKNGLINFCSETKALSNASGWTEEVKLGDVNNIGSASENILDLRSENKKFLVNMPDNFYHYFADITTLILAVHSVEPEIEIIVDESFFYATDEGSINKPPSYYNFVYKMLDNLGIRYKTIKSRNIPIIINNFVLPNDVNFFNKFLESATYIRNYIEKYIVDVNVEPYRKVYLSRQAGPNSPGFRVDSEKNLMDYFTSIGFEHTDQTRFADINDQIKFFYETRIICGLTGSGLANMLFMKDFQTVIELVSLIEFPGPSDTEPIKEEIHDFYKMIAFDKKHTLINIPNVNKKHEDLTSLISTQIDMLRNLTDD